jgi:hypothetical protein
MVTCYASTGRNGATLIVVIARNNFAEPQLEHEAVLSIAGKNFGLRTNSEPLLGLLTCAYPQEGFLGSASDAVFDIRVDDAAEKSELPTPCFRGTEHLVFATFGSRTFFSFDLLRSYVAGVVPCHRTHDSAFWQRIIIPIMIGVLGPSVGIAPLHCACLVRKSEGIMISGLSGAGKSTLSVALAQCGFNLLSDDWTYVTQLNGGLTAFGLSVPVKLLPDAPQFFPELDRFTPAPSLNGELAYEVNAVDAFHLSQATTCAPRRFFLLQRSSNPVCLFRSLSSRDVSNWLEQSAERLPKRLSASHNRRSAIIHEVAKLESFVFETGLSPHASAQAIKDFCESH